MPRSLTLSATLVAALFCSTAARAEEPTLTIGSKAPPLDIEHWLTDREGTVKPFHEFEAGKVYVVEFFATWCDPCVRSMPHLAELQKARAADGLTVVSVSDEDVQTLTAFLEKPTGEGETTYADVAKAYCLTSDPDGSVQNDYMRAARQGGIPTAFLVGKTGEIEWIGHPMQMDEPLADVIAGTWDRAAYLEKMREQQAMQAKFEAVQQKLAAVAQLLQAGEGEKALAAVDALIAETDDEMIKSRLRSVRLQVALRAGGPTALGALTALLEAEDASAEQLDEAAWVVFMMKAQGVPLPDDVVAAGTSLAEKAVKLTPESASALDTLAHLVALGGDVAKAIELQRQAVEVAPAPERPRYEAFLKELESKGGEPK